MWQDAPSINMMLTCLEHFQWDFLEYNNHLHWGLHRSASHLVCYFAFPSHVAHQRVFTARSPLEAWDLLLGAFGASRRSPRDGFLHVPNSSSVSEGATVDRATWWRSNEFSRPWTTGLGSGAPGFWTVRCPGGLIRSMSGHLGIEPRE